MEDAELCLLPGLVEDAEPLFQLSLRLHAGVTKMEPGLSTVARLQVPGAPCHVFRSGRG